MLAHLRARAVDGIEQVDGGAYRRTLWQDGAEATVEVTHLADQESLAATIELSSGDPPIRHQRAEVVQGIVARARRAFDLDADVASIGAHLARDPLLAPLVAARSGLRVPGAWDGFELGLRAVLGQQITVEAARRLAGRLVRACGAPLTPVRVARADLSVLGMPRARRRTLSALAQAAVADPLLFQPLASIDATVARLRAIPGIGEWTAQYIALRAAREPDAFPASDRGLLRAAGRAGLRTPADLLARAERWRPWRAYAAQHLWTADGIGEHDDDHHDHHDR
jgi:AraC family transcriptional regulator of adaptative response / DNA-3-methyladenine glycosylase II